MDRGLDYYALLGVTPDVDPETLRTVYRQLARTFHPDVNDTPEAAEHFRQITEAFVVLSDPQLRARYDRTRSRGRRPVGSETEVVGGVRVLGLELGALLGISARVRTRPLFEDELEEDERPLPAAWLRDPGRSER